MASVKIAAVAVRTTASQVRSAATVRRRLYRRPTTTRTCSITVPAPIGRCLNRSRSRARVLSAPPAGAGEATIEGVIRLVRDPIDVTALHATLPQDGALCLFLGVVRNENGGRPVRYLEYEAYEEMALPLMQEIEAETRARWPDSLPLRPSWPTRT